MLELEYRKLDGQEIEEALRTLEGWSVRDGKLVKSFSFERYREGIAFATRIGVAADEMDHHPDIHIGYTTVTVEVSTHSVQGLSPYDVELARRVNALKGD
jgi:4a-hydroxytetrahydrobiopterin dehydratase